MPSGPGPGMPAPIAMAIAPATTAGLRQTGEVMEAPDANYVSVGGASVAFQVFGDGPIDLVYHHPFCHMDAQWAIEPEAYWNTRLASFSRLILFDRRGCGASDRVHHGDHTSAADWEEDLLAVLDAVGSTEVALFVESGPGPMAIEFAARHQDRITSLVLGNTSARWGAAEGYEFGLSEEDIQQNLGYLTEWWGTNELARFVFPSVADDDEVVAGLARKSRAACTPGAMRSQVEHAWRDFDAREFLGQLHIPVLVVQGDNAGGGANETWTPNAHSQYLVEHIANARYVSVPSRDMLFYADDADVVIDLVAEFLTGSYAPRIVERRLTTVLFTDIVGSTERAVALGDRRWRGLLDAHDELVRLRLGRFGGHEVKSTGDGFLACFDAPSDAVLCALDIARSAARMGIEIRSGIHSGECELRGDDLAGLTVHVAARIEAIAGPGEVLSSATVKDLVTDGSVGFHERGVHGLKGVGGEWPLFAATAT
jgi:class 3 adenylate cyclase